MGTVFDPNSLHQIVQDSLGLPFDQMVQKLTKDLAEKYPGHIQKKRKWIFNNAGGAMGMMTVLHASISEYLIIFGSPIGTEGHSGRFYADDYFMILEGEQWTYAEGQTTRDVFKPGDLHHMKRREAKGYRMPDRCFALEYARGCIPLMLPFGVADTLTSTLDLSTLLKTFRIYGYEVLRELFVYGKI